MEKMSGDVAASLQSIAGAAMEDIVAPVGVLYVDLDCFFDFRIGALLSLISSKEEYDYLLANLSNYNDRREDKVMKYFPKLKFTDEDIYAFMQDTDNHAKLERISPPTDYYKYFFKFGDAVLGNNRMGSDANVVPQLFIGSGDVKLSLEGKDKLIACLKKELSYWNITITDPQIYDYGEEIVTTLDHMSIYKLGKFMEHGRFQPLLEAGTLLVHKSLHTFPFIEEVQDVKPGDEKLTDDQILQNTEIVFNAFCDFKFVIMDITYEK